MWVESIKYRYLRGRNNKNLYLLSERSASNDNDLPTNMANMCNNHTAGDNNATGNNNATGDNCATE